MSRETELLQAAVTASQYTNSIEKQLHAANATIEKLKGYVRHWDSCERSQAIPVALECTCDLSDLLKW